MAEFASKLQDEQYFWSVLQECRMKNLTNGCIRSTIAFTHGSLAQPLTVQPFTRREHEFDLANKLCQQMNQRVEYRGVPLNDINIGFLSQLRGALWWIVAIDGVRHHEDRGEDLQEGHFFGIRRIDSHHIQIADIAEPTIAKQLMVTDFRDLNTRIHSYHLVPQLDVSFYLFNR